MRPKWLQGNRRPGRSSGTGLARGLSKLGFCSRSQGRELVRSGRVRVNGQVRLDPEWRVDLSRDRVEVDNQSVHGAAKVYVMLNKPRGLVTTAADEHGRQTVYACLQGSNLPFLSPVGRLDRASEGLLLLTNDTVWAARITDPASHLEKVYHVQVDCVADERLLERIQEGITSPRPHSLAGAPRRGGPGAALSANAHLLSAAGQAFQPASKRGFPAPHCRASGKPPAPPDRNVCPAAPGRCAKATRQTESVTKGENEFLGVSRVSILRTGSRNSWLEITLEEGKNRHIRRLMVALGIEVLRLVRIAIGGLRLGDLPKGALRFLTPDEVQAFKPQR